MSLSALFNKAAGLAESYDGSEPAYRQFMAAAIGYEQTGGSRKAVDSLLDIAITAIKNVNREEDFLDRLAKGGAHIFHHGSVFVRPSPEDEDGISKGAGDYEPPTHEPRLREVAMALQSREIYFDDLVVDVGSVSDTQMRKWPYAIVTIPRLNAQIAVADQKGEALFVANPALPYINWALFEKKMAGLEKTPFENVTRIVHAGSWEDRMMQSLFAEGDPKPGPKVMLPGYVKAHRKSKYPLTEEIVVAMARMYRERHSEKQWPSQGSGQIDPEIVRAVTGDPHWREETWAAVDVAGKHSYRGLSRSVSQTLKAHGCTYYDLTEEMVVAMARLYRDRHPERQWPSALSGKIDDDIVTAVTGNPQWRTETWSALYIAGHQKLRGLGRSVSQILKAHGCTYDLTEEMVVAMARLYRDRHPERQWPSLQSGKIDDDIVTAVTGDPQWQAETWSALNAAGQQKLRGLGRSLSQTLKAHGCAYDLTEEMVVAMARLYRDRHPERQWPSLQSGKIDDDIVTAVTGDPRWQAETWVALNYAGAKNFRGLGRSLSQTLKTHGCAYDLTEEMVVAMARLYRDRHPERQWPSAQPSKIEDDIVTAVTGDPRWQTETWKVLDTAGRRNLRGLSRSLSQMLDANCPERGKVQGPVIPVPRP